MRFPRLFRGAKPLETDPRGTYPEPRLKDLILFVTDRCNMRCDHCIFWERIDHPGPEMTLDQLRRIARSLPPLRTLAVTGGEPFLRNDLPQIVETFFRDNQTHHIQVNTNGLLSDRMIHLVELDLASQCRHYLTYQVSLDGLEATHDRIRRLPGSFRKITENLRVLSNLTQQHPYFRVVALTNVNRGNYHEIEPLAQFLWNEIGVEHAYDLVRGSGFSAWDIPEEIRVHEDPRDCELPPLEELPAILETIGSINRREGNRFEQCVRQVEAQVGLYHGKPAPFRCLSAGRTAGVIYSDGSVTACEFTTPFAHLEHYDYDLQRLWQSPEAAQRRSQITGCSCAHSCFVLTSLQEWEEQKAKIQLLPTPALTP